MSWDLKIGEIKEQYITEEDIWQALNNFYYRSNVTMSYKYGYFKALLENLYNVNGKLELDYESLFYSFTKIYWNLVVHHNLWQSNSKKQPSSIQKILEKYCLEYEIPREWTFDQLPMRIQSKIIADVRKVGKKYVIGAFYGDTEGIFYEFHLKNEYLRFNEPVYRFLQKHMRMLTSLTNYHLAKYLEKYNEAPTVEYLLTKVEVISERSSLKEFYDVLMKYEENKCFYCGKSLSSQKRKTHVDHFIPWSYIQTDQLWNLVLACDKCNLQKSDKIAEEKYLYNLLSRNNQLQTEIQEKKDFFYTYENEKLENLYKYSKHNGYVDFWTPRSK